MLGLCGVVGNTGMPHPLALCAGTPSPRTPKSSYHSGDPHRTSPALPSFSPQPTSPPLSGLSGIVSEINRLYSNLVSSSVSGDPVQDTLHVHMCTLKARAALSWQKGATATCVVRGATSSLQLQAGPVARVSKPHEGST